MEFSGAICVVPAIDSIQEVSFQTSEGMTLQFGAEASSLLNRVNTGQPANTVGGSTYGAIRTLNGDPRNLQLSFAATILIMRKLLMLGLLWAALASAQTIFIARHAERTGEPDPPLNEDGQRRAEALARLLSDAGVYHFYTSDTVRARQTAEPLARRMQRPVDQVVQAEFDELIARIRKTADPDKPTLVIGHRETVPRIVKALGGGEIAELGSGEHDRLIVLTMLPGGKASVVTLRYSP